MKVAAEKDISFDNGLDGSIAEDCYFGMKASHGGYKFGFVEGEMWEKSPFTFWDFLQQRKRWIQGILLVVHSKMVRRKGAHNLWTAFVIKLGWKKYSKFRLPSKVLDWHLFWMRFLREKVMLNLNKPAKSIK